MSFHKQEFHETKRERKFYEGKKQKALRYIDNTLEDWHDAIGIGSGSDGRFKKFTQKLTVIRKMVNDI